MRRTAVLFEFLPGTAPAQTALLADAAQQEDEIRLRQPPPGLPMAYDSRRPASCQGVEFVLQGVTETDFGDRRIDGGEVGRQAGGRYLWPLSRGDHSVSATVWRGSLRIASVDETQFLVK